MTQTIEQLQAKNAELAAEVERLKARSIDYETKHDVACLTINQLQEKCEVRGKALMGQCKETKELRKQLAIAEAHNLRQREALEQVVNGADECLDDDGWIAMVISMEAYHICDEALSLPASSEALDKYVAEKVKELDEANEHHRKLARVSRDNELKAIRQRDLAVSAIENLVKQKGRYNTEIAYKNLVETLSAIKGSET